MMKTATAQKPTKADYIAEILGYGKHSRSALTRMTLAALEALAADLGCGGCENEDHCGSCECCEVAPVAAGVEVRVAKIRTTVKVDGRLVAYLLTDDRAAVVDHLRSGTHVGRARAIPGLHDTWVVAAFGGVVLAALEGM